MTQPAVTFDHVSKHYRGTRAYRSLRDDITGLLRPAPAPVAVEAITDVSLEISPGESLGIMGLNGAGKTTLLKLMCRIAYPSAGRITINGRIGALIEVGTGMHPELSGRENVRLYGRIMGLSRNEIARRFDEIVEFAGVGDAIDRQIKQYSSGMQLRLGFSIAAHLEPDIFVVDEAISVGDAGFQERCVERMTQLSHEGRTLIFVSHDLDAIETLCERGVVLKSGRLAGDGPAHEIVGAYFDEVSFARPAAMERSEIGGGGFSLIQVGVVDHVGTAILEVPADQPTRIRLRYRADRRIPGTSFTIGLSAGAGRCFVLASMLGTGEMHDVESGEGVIDCVFDDLPLNPRTYEIWGSVRGAAGYGDIIDWQRMSSFKVVRSEPERKGAVMVAMRVPVRFPHHWEVPSR
ncbi:MAG TPA: ABC transporter ATP-binding protein [Solirubrobacteraceae bacterium]|jgi:ABC-type polysaccharide/polyol phosphate transport system ATPase subunit|nr:ABC transporter ATP-binding protein [Solirubrobacteraceae bacterium]